MFDFLYALFCYYIYVLYIVDYVVLLYIETYGIFIPSLFNTFVFDDVYNDLTSNECAIGSFYCRAYTRVLKKLIFIFRLGFIDTSIIINFLHSFNRIFSAASISSDSLNILYILILILLLILDNDIHQNPGPVERELSVFHLNARSVRNKF